MQEVGGSNPLTQIPFNEQRLKIPSYTYLNVQSNMKKIISFVSMGLLYTTLLLAETECFLVKENGQAIVSEGDCKTRHAPCSTFKIPLSLMGYNEGILIDEMLPEWPFKEGYFDYIDHWKQPHTPQLWMKNSCVWYSQVLTQKIGMKKFQEYITKFDYGNQDLSGDKNQNNGLTQSWLSSSLEISGEEQLDFLQKLLHNELSVNLRAHEMTKNILFVENLPGNWKLYGKSGSGCLLNQDKTQKLDRQIGWFIGWIQKDLHTLVFVHFIEDKEKQTTYAGPRARVAAKEKLIQIIQNYN